MTFLYVAALLAGLVDPRERDVDLPLIVTRAVRLRDCPPDHMSERFAVDRHAIADMLAFNRAYRLWLRDVAALYPGPDVDQVIRETEALYAVWDALRDAKCEFYHVHIRREGLGRVLAAIGPEAFASGRMPPHVPVWRFEVIR